MTINDYIRYVNVFDCGDTVEMQPLCVWDTAHIVQLINLLDAELQQRAAEDVNYDDLPEYDYSWEDEDG